MNETLKLDIKEAVEKIAKQHPQIDKKVFEDIFVKILDKEMSPKEAMGFTNETMEAIYGLGYRLYNTGKYDSALQHFRLLFMLSPIHAHYSMALGACHHMLKNYDRAASLYELSSLLNPGNPLAPYHLSDCYQKLGDNELAIIALKRTCQIAKNDPEHLILAERAALMLNKLIHEAQESTAAIPNKGS